MLLKASIKKPRSTHVLKEGSRDGKSYSKTVQSGARKAGMLISLTGYSIRVVRDAEKMLPDEDIGKPSRVEKKT